MTNCWKAEGVRYGVRWAARVRRVDKAEPYVLNAPDGRPLPFMTQMEAELAAARHLISLWNTEECFDSTKSALRVVSQEEKVFGTVTSTRGKTKAKVHRRKHRPHRHERQRQKLH